MAKTKSLMIFWLTLIAGQAQAACPPPLLQLFPDAIVGNGGVTIPMTINGQTVQAVICTNCFWSSLGEKFAERAGVGKRQRTGAAYGVNADGEKTEYYTEFVNISLGNIPFKGKRQFLVDAGTGDNASIGLNLLQYFDLEIDSASKSASLHGWNECERPAVPWTHSAVQLPIKIRDDLMYAVVELSGKNLETRIATGSPSTIMGFSEARAHFGLTPQSPGVRRVGRLNFEGGSAEYDLFEYRMPELVISGVRLKDVPLRMVDIDNYGFELGMNELRQLHLYLAYGQRKIYVASAKAR